jgi:hypothetical protein
MQPEPLETPTYISTPTTASESSNSSQHGFLHEQLHSADRRDRIEGERAESADFSHRAALLDSSSADDAGLQEQLRRLSVVDRDDNRPKPSFQRISEYENALSPSPLRKQSEGPGFKIIKKKGNNVDGPHLDKFPNGMFHSIIFQTEELKFVLFIYSMAASNWYQRS